MVSPHIPVAATSRADAPINEDWRVGDLACCICGPDEWDLSPGADMPIEGRTYKIMQVYPGVERVTGLPCWGLSLSQLYPGVATAGYTARSFRKVRPETTACDAEFRAILKRPVRA